LYVVGDSHDVRPRKIKCNWRDL